MDASWHVEVIKRWRNKLRLIRYEMLGLIDSGAPLDPTESTNNLEYVEHYLQCQIQAAPEKGPPDTDQPAPNHTEPNLTDPRFEEPK